MTDTITFDREYRTIDKSGWDRGPWDDEPDKAQWVDVDTDLDCLIVRNRSGALCGYVGVSSSHPWHGVDYGRCVEDRECEDGWNCGHTRPDDVTEVHGGLTYAAACWEDVPESEGICHVPLEGRPDDVWWFGFDCHHAFDIGPGMEAQQRELGLPPIRSEFRDHTYRTISYVKGEVTSLARQIAEVCA